MLDPDELNALLYLGAVLAALLTVRIRGFAKN